MVEDFERCYRVLQSRDPRFDGWFVTMVATTGVYCRPSCPARTPKPENVRFVATAAAAQALGFRACLRCRPDAAPGSPEWNVRRDTVGRAMRMIADGVVDREGVTGLARRLGYGTRQLHRLLVAEVGAGPLALARAQRSRAARLLIETTELPMADVAFAAGFASVRQFNDTVATVFGRTPTALRRRTAGQGSRTGHAGHAGASRAAAVPGSLVLRLPYRRPMALDDAIDFLALRTIPGVEAVQGGAYRRTLRLPHGHGAVTLEPGGDHVRAGLVLEDLRDLAAAVGRCRHLLDLDADPEAVDAALGEDPLLMPLVARTPGRRVPRTVDGFELAARAVVGQQVSTAGARTVAGRLCATAGPVLAVGTLGTLSHLFPSPGELLDAPDDAFAMPAARRRALRALAAAVAGGSLALEPGADHEAVRDGLLHLEGIGEWTASYVAMRALGDPDAFLASDLGVRRAFAWLGLASDRRSITEHAARWRPWRAYALAHLWARGARGGATGSAGTAGTQRQPGTETQEDAA